jgi:Fe-S-cluster containining protein
MFNWDKVGTVSTQRSCGECTKCCDGTLTAEVLGQQIGLGVPCQYLKPRCTIYPIRPRVCREYLCEWKTNNQVPQELHPYLSNVIMHKRILEDVLHLKIFDFNLSINQQAFQWAEQSVKSGKIDHVRYAHYKSKFTDMPEVYVFTKDDKVREILQ